MRVRKALDRAAFQKVRKLMAGVLKTLEDSPAAEVSDAAVRMLEEVEAWTPRYFDEEKMALRREMRATGTVLVAGEDAEPVGASVEQN